MNLNLSNFLVTYWPVVLIVGFVLTFFGYYLVRISLAIIGLMAGLYLGQYLWTNYVIKNFTISPSNAEIFHIVLVLIIAFLITSLFVALYKFALFMLGFIAGGMISYYIYNWIVSALSLSINHSQWVKVGVFVIFGLIFGLITIFNERRTVGTAMAAIGGLVTSFAILIPLSGYFNVKSTDLLNVLVSGKNLAILTVFVAIFLVLSILSVAIQMGLKRGKKGESKDQG
ncbi:TM7S3/TM198-like domain-containing protein [Athalassotoga saccharophila]|uniref:TM7S3/TM198-like domain-containing protein n=1 Tax=Athalassotoga saccharophila TaxID=1441386 RepID=UPI00137A3E00|nr:DUF4203 domain-containing protein [Athalassotoga saccharophila]BBJ28834.1 hypothetical protein ATHSA_1753 [Athalassotoga saccharophila]